MPTSRSAKKRLRQNITRRAHNRSVKSAVRTQLRKVREAVEANDLDTAEAEFRVACMKLDQAGAHRVLHPNTAARYKSRLSARIRAAKQGA